MKWPWRESEPERPVPLVVPGFGPWLDAVEYATANAVAIADNTGRRGNFVAYNWGPLVVGWQYTN